MRRFDIIVLTTAALAMALLNSGCRRNFGNFAENTALACSDGIDNDGDLAIDCADSDCAAQCGMGCGDGTCDPVSEDCSNCEMDCGTCDPGCGDGTCDPVFETCGDCPVDCGACTATCGDGTCDAGEACDTCASDCGSCGGVCGDGTCDAGEGETCSSCLADCGTCGPVCGNGSCEAGETCSSCSSDCGSCGPVCGNGACESGETCSSCSSDCGACGPVCGNGTCEAGETCSSCVSDCGSCGPVCGNGTCEAGESCSSCVSDCGSCGPVCGNGTCEFGEDCSTCSSDCGSCGGTCTMDFDSGAASGWSLDNLCINAGWNVDSFRSMSPSYSLYLGDPLTRNFDCSDGGSTVAEATSPLITLPSFGAAVEFWVFIDTEGGTSYDQLTLWVVDVFGGLTMVWDRNDFTNGANGDTLGLFEYQWVDLSAFNGQPIQLRFDFNSVDGVGNSGEGVYIDDIFVASGTCP